MVKLAGTFSRLQRFRTLVLGDFVLDTYTTGRVKRISPEAPVPVMEVHRQESFPGGAGNAARNLAALGGEVVAAGRIGADAQGEELKRRLILEGVDTSAMLVESGYKTPVKNRLIADSQQLLRVDTETIAPLSASLEEEMIERLKTIIPQVQIVAISDYGKGFLTNRLIAAAIAIAREAKIAAIVDPKGSDFSKYKGATVLKPNLSEAYAAAKMLPTTPLEEVARAILSHAPVEILLITRSEAGMTLFDPKGSRSDFPVLSKEVKDVTGAGDTVLAMICLALANGLEMAVAVQLANVAAGIAIERLGCVQVTLSEIAQRLLESNSNSKIFHEEHFFALKQALQGTPYTLFTLQPGPITVALFRNLQRVSQQERRRCVVYVPGGKASDTFVQMLASIQEVHYILLHEQSVSQLCHALPPVEVC